MNDDIKLPQGLAFNAIGRPVRRKEDQRLLTGNGKFTDDFSMEGQAYMALVRSPHPHARIVEIDTVAAKAMPGVLCVLTGADAIADGLKPIPHVPIPATRFDMKLRAPEGTTLFAGPHYLLPTDKVRHVGEAVALVVADTRHQAADAAEAVGVTYEVIPFVTRSTEAIMPGSACVWSEIPNNVLLDNQFGDAKATDLAFAKADHIVKAEFNIGRVTAVTMELRGALGHFDVQTERYNLYAGSGGAVKQKAELAEVLGVPSERVRVISLDVGGNFGARNRPYVEFGLVLWASEKLKRPVKYLATRSEAFLTDYQGRDMVTKVELALRKDGRFLAMRADNISNVGARCVSLSPLSKSSGLITGSYDIPAATLRARAVFTNTMSTNAYRSSGRPEVTYAIERLIDRVADELGFDRIKLRRKNLIPSNAMPYTNAVGMTYDSGTYEANMDLAMRIADWDGFKKRRREAKKRGKLLGLGFANYVESSIGAPHERAEITVKPEGRVSIVIGTQPSGQGHETSFSQVAADLLMLPVDTIDIVMGDTDLVSVGGGSHSGRSMRHAGMVITKAANLLIDEGKKIAALALGVRIDEVQFSDGRFHSSQKNRSFDLFELAKEASVLDRPHDAEKGLAAAANNESHDPVFPNGAVVCEVEVDPETGSTLIVRYSAVDDVGTCINPLIVHGQTHGGIAQGVGQAMWEQCYTDPASGQPICGSLMDYGMPRSNNLPSFTTEIVEVHSPSNPLGIKAGGEGGTTPALAVVMSAIADALREYRIEEIVMPAIPLAVWQAIQKAKASAQGTSANVRGSAA